MKKLTLTLGSLVAVAAPVAAVVACGSDDKDSGVKTTTSTRNFTSDEKSWITDSGAQIHNLDDKHVILTAILPRSGDANAGLTDILEVIKADSHISFVVIKSTHEAGITPIDVIYTREDAVTYLNKSIGTDANAGGTSGGSSTGGSSTGGSSTGGTGTTTPTVTPEPSTQRALNADELAFLNDIQNYRGKLSNVPAHDSTTAYNIVVINVSSFPNVPSNPTPEDVAAYTAFTNKILSAIDANPTADFFEVKIATQIAMFDTKTFFKTTLAGA